MINYLKEYFDIKTFSICIALVVIGLLSIYSATFDVNNAQNYYRQLVWAIIGFFVMLVVAFIPLRTIIRLSFLFYFLSIAFLLLLLIAGITIKGSKSWFGIAGLGGQPSELAKIATVLAFASYLSKTNISISQMKHLLIAIAIFVFPMLLILAQPDLGTAIVFLFTLIPMLYWVGAPYFIIIAMIVPLIVSLGILFGTTHFLIASVISAGLLYYFRTSRFAAILAFGITLAIGLSVQVIYENLPRYQQKRIATFLNPETDIKGAGYNVLQSKIAIGSGGLTGKGYMKGTQTQLNYIPEQWTDFIFCVPGEEFGFLGSSIILLLFLALLLHAINIAGKIKNKFSSIATIGIVGILSTHIIINIGMSMGLMPVIGIPLPFLSYGGSSLLANMTMAGLIMNFYANRKEY